MSLMTFSIVSLICITCSALILSNNRISDLEYKNEKLNIKKYYRGLPGYLSWTGKDAG